jgi:serine/threonine protein kinase
LAVILEYCPDGSLDNLIGKIDEKQTKKIMKEIMEGLVYIHKKGIIHRDIKPENILMMNGVPKITDLGLAQAIRKSGVRGKSGTLIYEAPEVLQEEKIRPSS